MALKMRWNQAWAIALLGLAAGLCAAPAAGQGYPSRPVKIVAGFPPGGGTDVTARLLGIKLSELWGQQIIVETAPAPAAPLPPTS